MRLDHFAAAAQQQLDCGFDRHHYPPDSFGSASGSKTEQVMDTCAPKAILKEHVFRFCFGSQLQLIPVCHLQTLYPLSLISGSLDEAKSSLSTASSAIGRNLTAHQGYAMVTGEAGGHPLTCMPTTLHRHHP